jgi:hypothetical protein
MSAGDLKQYLYLLQCNVCIYYNAMSAPTTKQYLYLLQYNVCT